MNDPSAVKVAAPAEDVVQARSLSSDAWYDLRRRPIFWIAGTVVLLMTTIAAFPWLFSSVDARTAACELSDSLRTPSAEHWFGFTKQGCDVYARVIYGTRASIVVGIFSTLISAATALIVGMLAGYFGGWVDAILSRIMDIVLGLPYLLGAIVVTRALASFDLGIWTVVFALSAIGWMSAARLIRASVIAARHQDYVQAARMLGAGDLRIMFRHILPNAVAPTIVVMMIALGAFIAAEATLSFLGVGARNTISWGADIAEAQIWFREATLPIVFPSLFLTVTVLAFIMLGDAVREALDPKLH